MGIDLTGRHPGTQQIMRWFSYDHLRDGYLRDTSQLCATLAEDMVKALPDGPELTTGLQKLLEAKDCFVRAAVADAEGNR